MGKTLTWDEWKASHRHKENRKIVIVLVIIIIN